MAYKSDMKICPYDKSHEIEPERMQFHLVKCAKNYPNQELVACRFNYLHRVPRLELGYHHEICGDRKKVDTFVNLIGDTDCPVKNMVPINEGSIPPCGEDWDSEPPCTSALDAIRKEIEEKPVLRALKVSSKAKKKTFHQQERQRISELSDSAQRMTLAPAPQSIAKGATQNKQSTSDAASLGKKARAQQTKQLPAEISGASSSASTSTSSDSCNMPISSQGGYVYTPPKSDEDDGFCQLPIPGRGRGRARNKE